MARHTYAVKVDGVETPFSTLSISMELSSRPWIFEVTFPRFPVVDVEQTIEIWRDSSLYFTGRSRFSNPAPGLTGKITKITGMDAVNHRLSTRNMTDSDTVTLEPKTQVQRATAVAGVSNGLQDTYGTTIAIRRDYDFPIDAITKEAGLCGWETKVHPNLNTIDFKAQVGSDKHDTAIFETGVNATLTGWEKRSDALWNRIYARGTDVTTGAVIALPAPGYVEDVASRGLYGVRSKPTLEPDVADQAALITRATQYLAKHKDPIGVYMVDVVEPSPGNLLNAYDIGDTVQLIASELSVNSALRINRMGVSYGPNGERISLQLAALALTFEDLAESYHCYSASAHGTDASVGQSYSHVYNSNARTYVSNATGGSHTHAISSAGAAGWTSTALSGQYAHQHDVYLSNLTAAIGGDHAHTIIDPTHGTTLHDVYHTNPFVDPMHVHSTLHIRVMDRPRI